MKIFLLTIAIIVFSKILSISQVPVTVQAESGTVGSDYSVETQAGITFVKHTNDLVNSQNPGNVNRVITYTVTFPAAGTYDLYARMRIGSGGANDDSYFYSNGFGTKSATNDNDWITVNQLNGVGYAGATDVVENGGAATTTVWKWLNISKYNGGEPPVSFTVTEGNLTQTFSIGARENGIDIDKFVFGLSNYYFTATNLDNGEPGTTTPPPQPYTPPGPAIAKGKAKFLGCAYSSVQKVNFGKYWNQVVPENAGKWGTVEATRDVMNWSELDSAYKLAKDSGIVFRFHVLVWGNQQPAWIESLPPAEQLEEIREWFTAVANRYPAIDLLEVVNEPINDPPGSAGSGGGNYINALGGSGVTGWDWIIKSFEIAREIFPATTRLMINEYNLENVGSVRSQYLTIINLLKQRNLIDAVGTQAHAFSLRGSSSSITNALNELAATGLPLYATELDIDDRIPPSTTGSDEVQRQEYQRIFPLYWEHPAIKGVTLWGYRPGHWRTDQGAYIVHSNGSERAAMVWLRQYVQSVTLPITLTSFEARKWNNKVAINWTTATEVNNDRFEIERSTDGKTFTTILNVRVIPDHRGNYQVFDNNPITGVNYYRLVQYDKDGKKTYYGVRIVNVGSNRKMYVQVYPNPASSYATIRTEPGSIVTIINQSGGTVKTFVMPYTGFNTVSVADLSSGTYIIRGNAHGSVITTKVVINRD